MKSKKEILIELIGKEVVLLWSEGGSNIYTIWNYTTFFGTEFKKEFGHHRIIEVGNDMIKTEWLGKDSLPNYPNLSGYFAISYIAAIHF